MAARLGIAALELLVVLAVLGIVAVGSLAWSDAGIVDDARALARHVARHRAWALTGASAAGTCVLAADAPVVPGLRARLVAAPRRGLAFGADGLPRTCDGGGVGNTTILLEHRGRQAAVVVSSLGRVRWELR